MKRSLLLVMCITFLFTMVIHSKAEARFLGIFGPSPKPKLYHYGMTDKEIKNVQTKLIKFGYLNDIADGIFGNNTLNAIISFQADAKIPADGVIGPKTIRTLDHWKKVKKPDVKKQDVKKSSSNNDDGWIPITVEATAYTRYDEGCGDYTYRGTYLKRGLIAVDPDIIPLGTKVYIPDYGYAVADDIGGAIQGYRIDLAMDTLDEAYDYGRREVTIYLIK